MGCNVHAGLGHTQTLGMQFTLVDGTQCLCRMQLCTHLLRATLTACFYGVYLYNVSMMFTDLHMHIQCFYDVYRPVDGSWVVATRSRSDSQLQQEGASALTRGLTNLRPSETLCRDNS